MLQGSEIHCQSECIAEHVACLFSVCILFVLCNPDKVRNDDDKSSVAFDCQKWPLILAAGYGTENPSNRRLKSPDTEAPTSTTSDLPAGAACSACKGSTGKSDKNSSSSHGGFFGGLFVGGFAGGSGCGGVGGGSCSGCGGGACGGCGGGGGGGGGGGCGGC